MARLASPLNDLQPTRMHRWTCGLRKNYRLTRVLATGSRTAGLRYPRPNLPEDIDRHVSASVPTASRVYPATTSTAAPRPTGPMALRRLPEWVSVVVAATLGAVVFAYQLPANIVVPTNIRWMMKADRGASLLEWLFERNERWTLPFGMLHTMMAPLVTTSDGLLSVPAKLVFPWVHVPWQYSGFLMLAFYMLQAVFGYLVLRALGTSRSVGLLGSVFFALSPTLLQRFEHPSLSAHWEILAAWWLYLRRPVPGPSWRFLVPWLLLLWIAVPTHPYIAAMIGAFAAAAYARAVWIDKLFSWWTATLHGFIALLTLYGEFWLFGFFVLHNHGEAGFGRFYADVFSFFNSAGSSSFVPRIPHMADSFDLFGAYESYYYLGLGVIVLVLIASALAIRERFGAKGASAAVPTSASRWPPMWPGVAAALVLFAYALSTPVRVLGHETVSIPIYAHMTTFTAWFRGSGRFAWPLYYLVMAVAIAEIARRWPVIPVSFLLVGALVLQVEDTRPLRAFVRRDYSYQYSQLEASAWHEMGRSFRALRLVPPIVANRIACRHYDQYSDYEIKFGVIAAREHMEFNSGSPARIDDLTPLCRPMLDSLERGLLDEGTVYIPTAFYREAIEWWARGRVVCGTIEEANVCVARSGRNAAAPLTRLLLAQEPTPPPITLHVDLRTGNQGAVDSTSGFGADSATGRVISDPQAHIYYGRPFLAPVNLVVNAAAVDTTQRVPILVSFNGQSRAIRVGARAEPDTLHFQGGPAAEMFSFTPGATGAADTVAGQLRSPVPAVRLRQLSISLE